MAKSKKSKKERKPTQEQQAAEYKNREVPTVETVERKFTDAEKLEMAESQNHLMDELENKENAKKEAGKQFDAEIAAFESQIKDLRMKINKGSTFDRVSCVMKMNFPANGVKTIYRKDTGERLRETVMTPDEMQEKLFEEDLTR